MQYTSLPALTYDVAALEPVIDAQTMELHHGKHHSTYVNNLNAILEDQPEQSERSLIELFNDLSNLPKGITKSVQNNGGGHYNHSLFWKLLQPGGSQSPEGKMLGAIEKDFGSFEMLQETMNEAGTKRFGSGWVWLVKLEDGELAVTSTANQDNPLMDISDIRGLPILGIDVWEHAYYLKYQNRRAEYLQNIWQLINWDFVAELYAANEPFSVV